MSFFLFDLDVYEQKKKKKNKKEKNAGRIWCGSICPFMIFGEIAQKGRQMIDRTPLKKWPRDSIEKWGPWFL